MLSATLPRVRAEARWVFGAAPVVRCERSSAGDWHCYLGRAAGGGGTLLVDTSRAAVLTQALRWLDARRREDQRSAVVARNGKARTSKIGRPSTPAELHRINKGITMPASSWAALDALAAQRRTSRGQLVEQLVLEAAQLAGL